MNMYALARAATATLAFAAVACGGGSSTPPPAESGTRTVQPPNDAVNRVPTPQDFEAALLEGGLTFEEYEEAFLAFLGCVAEHGWSPVADPVLTSRLSYDYDLRSTVREQDGPEARARALDGLEGCRVQYFDAVQRQWAIQTAMTEAEAQQARDHLGACMRAVGYPLPEHPSQADWPEYIRVVEGSDPTPREAFRACLAITQKEFGLLSTEVP